MAMQTFSLLSKPVFLFLAFFWGLALSVNCLSNQSIEDSGNDIPIKLALETAQALAPGKVVAHEKVEELVSDGSGEGNKTLQSVYRVKILNEQGIMKTLLIHRQTGLVVK